jgi:hypothetical protein
MNNLGYAIPYIKGTFQHILHPPGQLMAQKTNPEQQWYINDGGFFVEASGKIHWFGITNPYPEDSNYYGRGTHRHIGHASSDRPFGPWLAELDWLPPQK